MGREDCGMDNGKRVAAASTVGDQDRSLIIKIMQSFRPIAPKPISGSPCLSKSHEALGDTKSSGRRSKRKYVRVRNKSSNSNNNNNNINNNNKRKIKRGADSGSCRHTADDGGGFHKEIETLQLFPIKEEDLIAREDVFGFSITGDYCKENSYWDSLFGVNHSNVEMPSLDRKMVESWVTVECVTAACTNDAIRSQLNRLDFERVKSLEVDTCPGFISDGSKWVRWVNRSYRRMIDLNERKDIPAEAAVRLVAKEGQMEKLGCMCDLYGAVTCRVSVQCEPNGRSAVKMTVPCDVWKMCSGWFAWRLDVEAALKLGR